MHRLTAGGIGVAALVVLLVGMRVGWIGGRAYQRAVDAWWRFRNHMCMVRWMWRDAVASAIRAAGMLAVIAAVVGVAVAAVWALVA